MRFTYILSIFISVLLACVSFAQENAQVGAEKFSSIEIDVDVDFLYLPISCESTYRLVRIIDEDGAEVFNEPVMLASGKGQWYAPIDVSAHKGRKLKILYDNSDFIGAPVVITNDAVLSRDYSKDTGRPAYHISATNGVLGASSGLFFFDGKYYAFVLQNPRIYSLMGSFQLTLWVSDDLINWRTLNSPSILKSKISSPASAYVDNENVSKLFLEKGKGVLFASSNSKNETFLAYSEQIGEFKYLNDASPILSGQGKWPFIFFNKDAKLWTIVRTEEDASGKNFVAIYVSENLVDWELSCKAFKGIDNTNVNLVQFDVIGNDSDKKWALISGNGRYIVGNFDGRKFTQLSPKPINIFAGAVIYTQVWSNMPNAQVLASATIMQPLPLMLHIKQRFSNVMSSPWKLSMVKLADGQFQLRADVSEQFMEHIGFSKDVLGGNMRFNSNTFIVPNAYGNYCMYRGTFETGKNTDSIMLEIGVGLFGYDISSSKYFMRRLRKELGTWSAPLDRKLKDIRFKALVDTYSTEVAWFSGDIVLMMGDSFINAEQPVKVGAIGVTNVYQLDMLPVFRNKIKTLREATIDMFKAPKNEQKQSDAK